MSEILIIDQAPDDWYHHTLRHLSSVDNYGTDNDFDKNGHAVFVN